MGVWGAGLYSGDFAMDLRKTVGAAARLPFEPERLVDILCETEPTAANDPADEEHTTFCLAVAEAEARRRPRAISAAGSDISIANRLGAVPQGPRAAPVAAARHGRITAIAGLDEILS